MLYTRYVLATETGNAVSRQPAAYTDRHVGDGGGVTDCEGTRVNDGGDDQQEQEPAGGASPVDQWQHEGESHVYVSGRLRLSYLSYSRNPNVVSGLR